MDALLPTLYFGREIVAWQGRFSPETAFELMQRYASLVVVLALVGIVLGVMLVVCCASRAGRVDFYASYGDRSVALELKQKAISTLGEISGKNGLAYQWKTVTRQAADALKHFRTDPAAYPHPVAVGLLVIRVSIKVTSKRTREQARELAAGKMPELTEAVERAIKPDFLACYTPPTEMQTFLLGKQQSETRIFPGVIFAAVVPARIQR